MDLEELRFLLGKSAIGAVQRYWDDWARPMPMFLLNKKYMRRARNLDTTLADILRGMAGVVLWDGLSGREFAMPTEVYDPNDIAQKIAWDDDFSVTQARRRLDAKSVLGD